MKNLILIGAGDWGLEVWSWLEEARGYGQDFIFKGFIDQNPNALENAVFSNAQVIGSIADYRVQPDDVFVCTIANTGNKAAEIGKMMLRDGVFINLIHKSVLFFKNISLGKGLILSPNCVVSNNCVIGNHVSVNLSCTLGHDVKTGDYCQINSQCDLTGHVKIGTGVFIGSSVSIIPRVTIGDWVKIGAGSVVLKNVKSGKSVFGNPAKEIM